MVDIGSVVVGMYPMDAIGCSMADRVGNCCIIVICVVIVFLLVIDVFLQLLTHECKQNIHGVLHFFLFQVL